MKIRIWFFARGLAFALESAAFLGLCPVLQAEEVRLDSEAIKKQFWRGADEFAGGVWTRRLSPKETSRAFDAYWGRLAGADSLSLPSAGVRSARDIAGIQNWVSEIFQKTDPGIRPRRSRFSFYGIPVSMRWLEPAGALEFLGPPGTGSSKLGMDHGLERAWLTVEEPATLPGAKIVSVMEFSRDIPFSREFKLTALDQTLSKTDWQIPTQSFLGWSRLLGFGRGTHESPFVDFTFGERLPGLNERLIRTSLDFACGLRNPLQGQEYRLARLPGLGSWLSGLALRATRR